jgi:hypothetical protein
MRGNGRIRGFLGGIALALLATLQQPQALPDPGQEETAALSPAPASDQKLDLYIETYVTGYNTVVAQTDDDPCIAATGDNICGRHNVVACPRILPLGTVVEIHGKLYICEDRTARKFDGRFDISCDKDKRCPYEVAGWTTVKVLMD